MKTHLVFGRRRESESNGSDYSNRSVDDLLELSESEEVSERKGAVDAMGNLDKRYDPVMDRLRTMESSDSDDGVRSAASTALGKLASKSAADEYADTEAGTTGTGFDSEVGDSSLEAGEYDMESSMTDRQEDQIEARAEGKGLFVVIRENNFVTLDENGNKTEQSSSSGKVMVENTGSQNRITGVDLILEGVSSVESETGLEESTNIGVLAPGKDNAWSADYTFDKDVDPISVTQEYYDPETQMSPNFLGAEDKKFEAKITISNTTDKTIYNVKGEKTLNEYARMESSSISSGSAQGTNGGVTFEIEEIEAGGSVELTLSLSATLAEGVPSYSAGELKVSYENKDELVSGLAYKSVDGVSDFRQRVRRKQRETEPSFYDCEIILENKSEFVYDLNRFSVFAGSMDTQQLVLDWDGSEASEDEREIVPSEKVAFEFVFESPDTTPSFGEHIEFSVQNYVDVASVTELSLPAFELRFMAISISKAFVNEEGEEITEYELPSYVVTEVPTVVTVTGVGTFPLEGLIIRDELPDGFRGPGESEVSVFRNGTELDADRYLVNVEADELVVNVSHLEVTEEGGLKEDETISVKYSAYAENPEPRDEAIRVQSHGEGFIYEDEENKVTADSEIESLNLVVVHRRDDFDIGKYIQAIEHGGKDAYRITLEAENYGTSTLTIEIQDLIPAGFGLDSESIATSPDEASYDEPASSGEGMLHGWTFSGVEPEAQVSASYIVVEEESSADPRKLQSVYKG